MLKGIAQRSSPIIIFKSGVPVSVICVAATFTGVTYANNGGKIQFVSSGVHGLTTSPAVGASVYVSWAGGTGISGLYTVLSVDDTLRFTVDLPYVVGLGTPTVVALGTTIEVYRQELAAMSKTGHLEVSAFVTHPTLSVLRAVSIKAGPSLVTINTVSTSSSSFNAFLIEAKFKNNNATNSQVTNTSSGIGAAASTATATTIDTSVSFDITASLYINAANERITLQNIIIKEFL